MRRILSAILILALLAAGAFAPGALAEEEPSTVTLAVGAMTAAKDEEVDLPITIGDCAGVDSIQFNLNYDASALQIASVTPGTVFPAEYCVTNTNEAGRVRVAAVHATGLTSEGDMLLLKCRMLTDAGSAVTLSDVLVTTVDAEYNQSKAYVSITDGGVSGGALPAPVVTPWIPETPVPTPSPTPEPTEQPEAMVLSDEPEEAAPETPAPEPETPQPAMLPYIIVGVLAILIVAGIVIILVSSSNSRRRRRRKRRKKRKNASRSA